MCRHVRRQNADFVEGIFFFSEADPNKAAQFLFNQKKNLKNLESDDVCQDKHRHDAWRLPGQERSELRDIDRVLRPLLPIVLEKGSERLRSKKPSHGRTPGAR